jgi:MoaA/NifB/PqqE/SkfB family radical SAM enzyme
MLENALFALNARLGHLLPWRLRQQIGKRLITPKTLTVDLTGSCNLRCPSCPVGSIGPAGGSGLMDIGLFRRILERARSEHGVRAVALHNWTEPFLHPELPGFVHAVRSAGLVCSLSTNLTLRRNIEEVVAAAPDVIRVSVSGFTQESYGLTHVRGDIAQVKANMQLLSGALRRQRPQRTRAVVLYHKYRHNLTEMEQMRALARSLGFEWEEIWAYYMSVEKMSQLLDGTLNHAERDFVENRLALPIAEAVKQAASQPINPCPLLEDQIVLDYKGNARLCCAVYDAAANTLGSFLSMEKEQLVAAKQSHSTCNGCMSKGLHRYFTYYDHPGLARAFDTLAKARAN